MSSRRPISEDVEAKLLVEARNTCCLCWTSREVQIHHIIPVEKGGDNSEENLVVVCLNCHSGVHTRRYMARNISVATLRLYKETWLDLVRRFPSDAASAVHAENDIATIRDILRQAHRRALFFPFDQELFPRMYESLNEFRIFMQQCGYRLIQNDAARGHAQQIFKALIEIEAFAPQDSDIGCHFSFYGRDGLAAIDVRRRAACFHINELAKLAGLPEVIPESPDLDFDDLRSIRAKYSQKKCFGRFDGSAECGSCDFRAECVDRTSRAHAAG